MKPLPELSPVNIARLEKINPAPYWGGKQLFLKDMLPLIPAHSSRIDAFCGGCCLAALPPFTGAELNDGSFEIWNDKSDWVMNFYEQCQLNRWRLIHLIGSVLVSETQYKRAMAIKKSFDYSAASTEEKLQAAWAFFMINNLSVNATNQGFPIGRTGVFANKKRVRAFCNRIEKVILMNRDALDILKIAKPDTWVFLDPPYIGTAHNGKKIDLGPYAGYTEADLIALLDRMETLDCYWMLTHFPSELIREYVKRNGWSLKEIEKIHCSSSGGIAGKKQKIKIEWIVTNYKIKGERRLF